MRKAKQKRASALDRLVRHQKLLKVKDDKSIELTSHLKLVIIMYPYNDPGEEEGKQS